MGMVDCFGFAEEASTALAAMTAVFEAGVASSCHLCFSISAIECISLNSRHNL